MQRQRGRKTRREAVSAAVQRVSELEEQLEEANKKAEFFDLLVDAVSKSESFWDKVRDMVKEEVDEGLNDLHISH